MLNLKNWELTIGLGLIASLMNDVFYGAVKYFAMPNQLASYYWRWLIPQNAHLFDLNLGFAVLPVFSWTMALSIYIRIAVVVGLLWNWKLAVTKSRIVRKADMSELGLDGLKFEPLTE